MNEFEKFAVLVEAEVNPSEMDKLATLIQQELVKEGYEADADVDRRDRPDEPGRESSNGRSGR